MSRLGSIFYPVKPIYIILMIAAAVRLAWILVSPALPVSDFAWYEQAALSLINGSGYSIEKTPTAYFPPGYPLLLAGIYAISGPSLFCGKLLNVLLGTLTVGATYILARNIFTEALALLAAALVTFTPSLILYSGLLASENLAIPLLLVSLVFYLISLQDHKVSYLIFAGMGLGLSALTRPVVLLLPGFWLGYLLLKGYTIKKTGVNALLLSGSIMAIILPWTVRNYLVFDRFIPISTNGGSNLYLSFNEKSTGAYADLEQLFSQDEFLQDKIAQARATDFIQRHPTQAILLTPLKLFHLFRDDVSGVIWNLSNTAQPVPGWLWWGLLFLTQGYYILLLALALGAIYYQKSLRKHQWYSYLLTPILSWLVVHSIFFGDDRFHLPILPIITIFSAFTWHKLAWQSQKVI